jgi:hypothetical protein
MILTTLIPLLTQGLGTPGLDVHQLLREVSTQSLRLGRYVAEVIPWGKSELDFFPPNLEAPLD